ncbi:MAG: carboxypeptidase regulatory-like domain-containing protein [Nitrosomonadales bacterium]|nr:carboxypeptidase regulatory-like domain-containing protein [Nitrosomonadales bacterium]
MRELELPDLTTLTSDQKDERYITQSSFKEGFSLRNNFMAGVTLGIAMSLFGYSLQAFAGYKEMDVSNGGAIKGKVTFKGLLPSDAVEKIAIVKNIEVCDTNHNGVREVHWIDVKGDALRNAFVFIDGIDEGKKWLPPPPVNGKNENKYVIEQKTCRFTVWAEVVRPGPVTIRNSDMGVLHNINTREIINAESDSPVMKVLFNFGQPEVGDIEKEIKPRRAPFIGINCEAHNFMFGYRLALEHPYAVVVGDDGTFSLADVPPGTYTVKAWHPRLGFKEGKVTVTAKGAATVNFEFSKK